MICDKTVIIINFTLMFKDYIRKKESKKTIYNAFLRKLFIIVCRIKSNWEKTDEKLKELNKSHGLDFHF